MILFVDEDEEPTASHPFPGLAADLDALAQPTRLAIVLRLLSEGELNATAIGSGFNLKQPTVSWHLKLLTSSGLLARRQRGAEVLFRIADVQARRLGLHLVDLGRTLTAGGDRHGDEDGRTAEPALHPPD